jgi:hypothetical protein
MNSLHIYPHIMIILKTPKNKRLSNYVVVVVVIIIIIIIIIIIEPSPMLQLNSVLKFIKLSMNSNVVFTVTDSNEQKVSLKESNEILS